MLGGCMLSIILPKDIWTIISSLDLSKLTEIRIRKDKPIMIHYGQYYYINKFGITHSSTDALYASQEMIKSIILSSCQHSIYAHNEEIKQGYISLNSGMRIGVCGEIVWDNDNIKTIKNFSSLNIRIPHSVPNCSLNVIPYIADLCIHNTLVLSPPGAGKTTMLNDLARQFSVLNLATNILIVDERYELGRDLDKLENIDIYKNCNKQFGIINGIRTMTPDVIILDELITSADITALNYAISSGVNIIASTHCANIFELDKKPIFKPLLDLGIFDRFVVLSRRLGPGTIEGVYNETKKCIYLGEK